MSDIATGDNTPHDMELLGLLIALAVLMFVGAATHPAWVPFAAALARRGSVSLGVLATALVLVITPTTNGIVGASRMLMLWPAAGLMTLAYILWAWRAKKI